MALKLGTRVRCTITGFEGIATGRCEYLYGCVQIKVQGNEIKDGKPVEGVWLDEGQLTEVKDELKAATKPTGGPREDAPTMSRPPSRFP